MQAKIRVLVVEDSMTVRHRICEVLSSDPMTEVVGEASDGKSAIELCRELRPDIITLDMMLPIMSGLAATEYIMAHFPTPILIVSASTNRGELFKTYEALAAGAVDVLEKPTGREAEGQWEHRLLATIKLVSRIKVITHLRAKLQPPDNRRNVRSPLPVDIVSKQIRAVAIGASTGGPAAILQLLRALPGGYPFPILLVVHIGGPFGSAFAEWLDGETAHRVRFVRNGETLAEAAGTVIVAPPDNHLTIEGGRLSTSLAPARHSCRPSVDVLFESVARELGDEAAGCLLTGMGHDGAAGLLAMRQRGALTIAQDEATCVVYGMPREAVLLGAASRILNIQEIAETLADLARTACPTP